MIRFLPVSKRYDHPMKHQLPLSLLLFAVTVFVSPAIAVEKAVHKADQILHAHRWDVTDISFPVDEVPDNATTLDFSATFSQPDGKQMTAPGFFNGGKEFVVRFTPPAAGKWEYVTSCSLSVLDGARGGLDVASAREGRRGGIVIDSKDETRFRYENGDTYYPIAFESDWLFALDAENADGIPNTRQLVDSLAENGFNQIVMNVFAYDVKWAKDKKLLAKYDYGSPDVFPFGGDNGKPDYSQLNIEYFQRLDRVVEYLDQKGIAAHLMIYVWNKRVNWPDANSEADNRYFDYVVRRYQAYPNLVWDISKEALGYGHTDVNYISERIERLRRLDNYKRLVTVHDYGYCRKFKDNVDFVSVQLWLSELYGVMRNVCENIPGKPILNIEHGGYERSPYVVFTGNYTSPEVCLERAYQCVFAGTYPTHYWQGAAWNVVIPDIKALEPKDRPRLEYYRHMRSLIEKHELGGLTAGEKKSNAGFCLHNDDDLFVYYVPKECDFFGVRMPKEKRGQTMVGMWFNPFDGTYSGQERKKITQWPAFEIPKRDGFRILVIEIQPDADDDG